MLAEKGLAYSKRPAFIFSRILFFWFETFCPSLRSPLWGDQSFKYSSVSTRARQVLITSWFIYRHHELAWPRCSRVYVCVASSSFIESLLSLFHAHDGYTCRLVQHLPKASLFKRCLYKVVECIYCLMLNFVPKSPAGFVVPYVFTSPIDTQIAVSLFFSSPLVGQRPHNAKTSIY